MTLLEIIILISYNIKTGIATTTWLATSGGVIIAANINTNTKLTFSSNDYSEFNKKKNNKNKKEKLIKNQNIKIKVVDFTKLKDNKKSLKNKMGIEKIKVVYFD